MMDMTLPRFQSMTLKEAARWWLIESETGSVDLHDDERACLAKMGEWLRELSVMRESMHDIQLAVARAHEVPALVSGGE